MTTDRTPVSSFFRKRTGAAENALSTGWANHRAGIIEARESGTGHPRPPGREPFGRLRG